MVTAASWQQFPLWHRLLSIFERDCGSAGVVGSDTVNAAVSPLLQMLEFQSHLFATA